MGLLTDPAGLHGRPFQVLVKHQGKICLIFYASAILWYTLLGHDQISSETYLSENALLPGLVTVGCDVTSHTSQLTFELEKELEGRRRGIPDQWITRKMAEAGIIPYTHNFTLNYPLGRGMKYTGKNVYGILYGGGSSTESIVLSVPYRDSESIHPRTDQGLVLLLAIGMCFRKQKYWAKDIILLVSEHEQLGMEAWLEAYHGTTCGVTGVLDSGDLVGGRGGAIQAAVNLELGATRMYGLDVKVSGLNGQLPNLDLANLVHKICAKEKIRHTFARREGRKTMKAEDQWLYSLKTMTSMVLTQATGVPDGNHGLFHRFGIEAVTLEGYTSDLYHNPISLYHLGRVIEGVFRSMNNLLERFHQSYFFYLLLDKDRFVSIGLYMPCVGLIVGALFVKAFAVYLHLKTAMQPSQDGDRGRQVEVDLNSGGVGMGLLLCYSFGVVASSCGALFTKILPMQTDSSLLMGYSLLTVVSIILPLIFTRRLFPGANWVVLEITSLVHYGTLLIAVAMHNFSLAFLIALVTTPINLIVGPYSGRLPVRPLLLFTHPLSLLSLSVFISASLQFPLEEIPLRTLTGLKQSLLLSLVDSMVYGSWTFTVATLFYLPNWCMFWIVAHGRGTPPQDKPKKE